LCRGDEIRIRFLWTSGSGSTILQWSLKWCPERAVRMLAKKELSMGLHSVTVEISEDVLVEAERIAAIDDVPVSVLIESLVRRHAEYVDSLETFSDMPKFSLTDYAMVRDPGETEEDYQQRLGLFR
jgi:hypothetical protein